MAEYLTTIDVRDICGAVSVGYSVVNERQIVINKAVVPQFDEVSERYFINCVAIIRTTEGIDDKPCDNKIGTRSVL